jgi:hypothetical protein
MSVATGPSVTIPNPEYREPWDTYWERTRPNKNRPYDRSHLNAPMPPREKGSTPLFCLDEEKKKKASFGWLFVTDAWGGWGKGEFSYLWRTHVVVPPLTRVKKRDVERKRKKFCSELRRGGMRRREGKKKKLWLSCLSGWKKKCWVSLCYRCGRKFQLKWAARTATKTGCRRAAQRIFGTRRGASFREALFWLCDWDNKLTTSGD